MLILQLPREYSLILIVSVEEQSKPVVTRFEFVILLLFSAFNTKVPSYNFFFFQIITPCYW